MKQLEQDSIHCGVKGDSQAKVSWVHFGDPAPPQAPFTLAFSLDHSHLGGGAAGLCAKRRGAQPRLEALAGGRELVPGKLGEGWVREPK